MASWKSKLQRHTSNWVIFLVGLVLVLAGVILGIWPTPHPHLSTILVSVGSSLLAASVATFLSAAGEEIYEKFRGLGIGDVFFSRSNVPNSQWVTWLRQAKRHCTLLGIAHGNWCRDANFPQALRDCVRNGVEVKIFFLNPRSEAAQIRAREDKPRNTVAAIRESVIFVWDLRSQLETEGGEFAKRLKLYLYDATPSSGVMWVDDFMVATHYLAGFANLTSPAFLVEPVKRDEDPEGLFAVYARNVQAIEEHNSTEITQGIVDELRRGAL